MKNKIDIGTGRYWDRPWSLVSGCSPCSPGCDHCWAASFEHRLGAKVVKGHSGSLADGTVSGYENHSPSGLTDGSGAFNGIIGLHTERLSLPLRVQKPTVFSVRNDLFHESVPFDFILSALVHAIGRFDLHKYLILTKRPGRMVEFFEWMTTNAPCTIELSRECWWWGLTVCNQQEADEKIPTFIRVPGNKFLSIEPMLGPIDLSKWVFNRDNEISRMMNGPALLNRDQAEASIQHCGINTIILGGESGPGARPMHPDWVRSVRDQCAGAGVPFFFKQWGEWMANQPDPDEPFCCVCGCTELSACEGGCYWIETDEMEDRCSNCVGLPKPEYRALQFFKIGKKATGRELDGRSHDELPWTSK